MAGWTAHYCGLTEEIDQTRQQSAAQSVSQAGVVKLYLPSLFVQSQYQSELGLSPLLCHREETLTRHGRQSVSAACVWGTEGGRRREEGGLTRHHHYHQVLFQTASSNLSRNNTAL